MTEETKQQEKAYADLLEQVAQKDRRIEELETQLKQALERIEELERRVAKDSHNSSKPPSSDGLRRRRGKQRKKSEKPSGGQPGHQGHTLLQVRKPDSIISHRPRQCEKCHLDLRQEPGTVKERRQVHDVPDLHLQVQEHQLEEICCPSCQHRTSGTFPVGVQAPAQYGPRVQAAAVYLSQFQLLPLGRTCEALEDLYHSRVCEATVLGWIAKAAKELKPTIERLKQLLVASSLQHSDETGFHIKDLLYWTHVNATRWLTLYSGHRKRGKAALEDIGIWPRFRGRAMHDRWASYDQYSCAHSLCGAHLLRDCVYVAEQEKQPWAQEMFDHLLTLTKVAEQWRAQGAKSLPKEVRDPLLAQYFAILASGFAALVPPTSSTDPPKKRGRKKQLASKNLLDVFLKRADQILCFLDDLSLPFTNNLAERDLRMIKVQQKISGTFRSEEGATAFFAIRSYLSTIRKQGRSMLAALAAVFTGSPFPVAWAGPE